MGDRTAHVLEERERTTDVITDDNADIDFQSLLLSEAVQRGLLGAGFQKPSPIQLKAIPLGRCGLDLIVQAKSGTGKTCVFSVIALESIIASSNSTQVLVLAPTREIALQIHSVIESIGYATEGLRCHTFIGGKAFGEDRQKLKKCHIAVGTPGRINQLLEYDVLKTDSIRLFVLDEADKLLDEKFQGQVNCIYHQLPENKQMLALSATYPEYLAKQLTQYMRDPTFVRLNPKDLTLQGIKQYYKIVPAHNLPHKSFGAKVEQLLHLLSRVAFNQCLIFSNLQIRAQSLCDILLESGWPATYIAGSQDQWERIRAMEMLKTFQCRILISTDLTARGIDAENVNLVVNMDVPYDYKTYLHRIGRAGRFGTHGAAVTFASEGDDVATLQTIKRLSGSDMVPLPDPVPTDLLKRVSPVVTSRQSECTVKNIVGEVEVIQLSTMKSNNDGTNETKEFEQYSSATQNKDTGMPTSAKLISLGVEEGISNTIKVKPACQGSERGISQKNWEQDRGHHAVHQTNTIRCTTDGNITVTNRAPSAKRKGRPKSSQTFCNITTQTEDDFFGGIVDGIDQWIIPQKICCHLRKDWRKNKNNRLTWKEAAKSFKMEVQRKTSSTDVSLGDKDQLGRGDNICSAADNSENKREGHSPGLYTVNKSICDVDEDFGKLSVDSDELNQYPNDLNRMNSLSLHTNDLYNEFLRIERELSGVVLSDSEEEINSLRVDNENEIKRIKTFNADVVKDVENGSYQNEDQQDGCTSRGFWIQNGVDLVGKTVDVVYNPFENISIEQEMNNEQQLNSQTSAGCAHLQDGCVSPERVQSSEQLVLGAETTVSLPNIKIESPGGESILHSVTEQESETQNDMQPTNFKGEMSVDDNKRGSERIEDKHPTLSGTGNSVKPKGCTKVKNSAFSVASFVKDIGKEIKDECKMAAKLHPDLDVWKTFKGYISESSAKSSSASNGSGGAIKKSLSPDTDDELSGSVSEIEKMHDRANLSHGRRGGKDETGTENEFFAAGKSRVWGSFTADSLAKNHMWGGGDEGVTGHGSDRDSNGKQHITAIPFGSGMYPYSDYAWYPTYPQYNGNGWMVGNGESIPNLQYDWASLNQSFAYTNNGFTNTSTSGQRYEPSNATPRMTPTKARKKTSKKKDVQSDSSSSSLRESMNRNTKTRRKGIPCHDPVKEPDCFRYGTYGLDPYYHEWWDGIYGNHLGYRDLIS